MGVRKTKDVMNTSGIAPFAKKAMKAKKISVKIDRQTDKGVEKYSKRNFLHVHQHYDAFENFLVVRRYVQQRYNISIFAFEIMLYLYPKQYFTTRDFAAFPKPLRFKRVQDLMKEDMCVRISVGKKITYDDIFTLSKRCKSIVKEFYHCLSGEKKMPEEAWANPLARTVGNSPYDRKAFRVIKSLNKMEVPESRKALYEKKAESS